MISQTVPGPAMCFHRLIEEHHEHPPCDYEHYVAGEVPEDQLRDHYQAKWHELVPRVGEQLEKGRWGGVWGGATDAQEIEEAFEDEGLEEPKEKGFCVDVAKGVWLEPITPRVLERFKGY